MAYTETLQTGSKLVIFQNYELALQSL